MRSVVRGLGLATAMLLVVAAASAVASGTHYDTKIAKPTVREHPANVNGGRLVVATRLTSAKRACYVSREVTLYREHGSIDVAVSRDYTDTGGRALFHTYGPQAFYYVRAEKKSGYHYFCPSRRSVVSSAF